MNTVPSARPPTDCQVLVVGAGPTGLVLAAELLARGVCTRIIDQGDAVARQARAIGVHARTLEILGMMGGQTETITAGYVVGCDGAHSRVRRELGLTFHGHPYPQDWLLADVLLDWDLHEDSTHAFFRPDGLPMILFPMRGHRWRLTLPFAGDRDAQAPTLEEIQRLTDQRTPRPVTVSDPSWLACFRSHRRSASAYRLGRVLLAGDAVHIHSPAGGQGLNTGILDAHNLAWKLALVAAGRAPDTLLDTYGAERRPVAEDVLWLTHALVRYGTLSHPLRRRVRDVVVPALSRSPAIQRRASRRMSQVYVSYPPGPLVRPGRDLSEPRAGQRMPDIPVYAGGQATALHDVLHGGRHVLVAPVPHAATVLDDPVLRLHRSDLEIVTPAPSEKPTGTFLLIRPDGHVAARGNPGSMDTITGYLRDLFRGPAGRADQHPEDGALHAACGTVPGQDHLEDPGPLKPC
jgi:4,5-epoxidase